MKKQIVLNCIDEAHVSYPCQWGNDGMREQMYLAPAYLRVQVLSTTKALVLAMTASAKVNTGDKKEKSEVEQIKIMCSLQFSETTTISISPVLHNHNYVVLKKPSSVNGFYGANCHSFTPQKTGSVHLLWRIYLEELVSSIKNNKKTKRAILYVKRMEELMEIDDFLTSELGHLEIVKDRDNCPWVTSYSSTGPITAEKIRERARNEDSNISL